MSPEEFEQYLNEYLSSQNQSQTQSYSSSNSSFNNNSSNNNSSNQSNTSGSQTFGFEETVGFQDLNPNIFCMIGELAGQVMASNLPFNVQNALGNWLLLVGQVMVTFNSQQQYFIGGAGRTYVSELRGVLSPEFTHPSGPDRYNPQTMSYDNVNSNGNNTTNQNNNINDDSIRKQLNEMSERLREIQKEIDRLKANNNML